MKTEKNGVANKYGAYYYNPSNSESLPDHVSRDNDLYSYKAKIGSGEVEVERGDSLITLSEDLEVAYFIKGRNELENYNGFAAVIRGYQCGDKACSVLESVNLPYVNGCATRQIFPPERIGDPTLQQLTIPPYTAEQMHHIHSTPRIVYVLSGFGYSVVGQAEQTETTKLEAGMLCILDPMSPHHFVTEDEYLTVLPVHVFSSTPAEQNHPMFNGTKEV